MISVIDAAVLARTKLKTRRIRTGIATAVSGLLFGLLIAVVVIFQGSLTSAENFSQHGLGDRYIMSVSQDDFEYIDRLTRHADVIDIIEKEHAKLVKQKTAEAKQLGIDYHPEVEDPTPISKDEDSGEKYIQDHDTLTKSDAVSQMIKQNKVDTKLVAKPYNPIGYPSASVPLDIDVTYMKDGQESVSQIGVESNNSMIPSDHSPYILAIGDGSIAEPFVSSSFDPNKGEIPVVIPYSDAEKMLGLKPLVNSASSSERLDRIYEVRDRVNEVTAAFCYRNQASRQLLAEAQTVEKYVADNQAKPDYIAPQVRYNLPAQDSCAAVTIASDNRSEAEKQVLKNRQLFDSKFNGYQPPEQYKINVRGVGVAPDMESTFVTSSMGGLAASLLMSYTDRYWSVPDDLLAQVADEYKPGAVFDRQLTTAERGASWLSGDLVEFGSFEDAKKFNEKYGCSFGSCGHDGVMATSYGSSSIVIAEAKSFFNQAMSYAVVSVSIFAMLILAGTIGRTIADGRKESAVFRAIGAKRSDILSIYVAYTLMLAVRIVIFALLLGLVLAWALDIWQWQSATVGAQLAFGGLDRSIEFHFFDIRSPYLLAIVGVIIAASLLAMIPPILRAMRRTPIQDMRDDN